MSNIFSRLRVALRLARRDLAAHKIRTVVALLLFALPVSLVVGFASMVEGYDRSHVNSLIGQTGHVVLERDPATPLNDGAISDQFNELSAAIGDLADQLSPGVRQLSEFRHGDRDAQIVVTSAADPDTGDSTLAPAGTVTLNDSAAFLMDATEGDTVNVDGAELTVRLGADYRGPVVNAADVPVNSGAQELSWYFPDDSALAQEIVSALHNSPERLSTVSISGPTGSGDFSWSLAGAGSTEVSAVLTALSVIVLGVLLVSAVISPVFAVAARRQRRAMGLMSAVGSAPRDLRLVMLVEGLAVGLLGAVAGLVLSTGVAATLISLTYERGFHWSWSAAIITTFVALACGVTSALVPAVRAGREDPVQALTDGGSMRMTGFHARMLAGPVILSVAVSLIILGGADWQIFSIALCGTGLILSSSLTVWLMSQAGRYLPTSGRLAVRDSLRNHHRTVPAVAAIAGVTFLATLVLSIPSHFSLSTPYRDDVAVMSTYEGGNESLYSDEIDAVAERMNARSHHTLAEVTGRTQDGVTYQASPRTFTDTAGENYYQEWVDIRATDGGMFAAFDGAEPPAVREATEALSDGKAVVSDPSLIEDGRTDIELRSYDPYYGPVGDYVEEDDTAEPQPADETLSVPAVVVPALAGTGALDTVAISPETAASLDLDVRYQGTVFLLDAPVSMVEAALATTGLWPVNSQFVTIDTPAVDGERALMIIIPVALSWILTLGTVLLVIVLAAAESRRDIATITAVGAAPGLLRRFSAAQAVFIALPGTVIGVVVGLLPKVSQTARDLLQNSLFYTGFLTPSQWLALGLTAVVGPVLAWIAGSVIGAVTSRDRSPVRRR